MITRKDVMPTNYYKKEPFTGSDRGMRYMLRKKEQEDQVMLEAVVWPQPFCFEKTAEGKKEYNAFSFDEAGIAKALEWLNETYEKRKEEFLEAQQASSL